MILERIIRQFVVMLQHSDIEKDDQKSIEELLVVIALKCFSIWKHDQRYDTNEGELITEAKSNPIDRREAGPIEIATAQVLWIEFDGFLVQVKSVLDHMVHILHYTLDLKFSALSSFGDHGNKIITLLRNNVSAKVPGRLGAARLLIEHIEINQWWLTVVIESRDRMNHYMHGGLSPLNFLVTLTIQADGTEKLYRPAFAPGRTVKEEMEVIFKSLLDFVEYFIGIALAPRMSGYAVKFKRTDDKTKPQWQITPRKVVEEMLARGEIPPGDTLEL
jgi:hypothetical protein